MLFQRLFGGSRFLKRMNTLMEVYACSHNAPVTYRELQRLKPLIRTEGERALYELNRASLLYDMKKFREAADVIVEIPSLNPEFDAKCAALKTMIMDAFSISLYAMFIAIIVPPARDDKHVLLLLAITIVLSCIFYFVPVLQELPSGINIIVCSVICTVLLSLLFPHKETEDGMPNESSDDTGGIE